MALLERPRLEIVFRKGRPVAAFFHLRDDSPGKTGRQLPLQAGKNAAAMFAHYDDHGKPTGLEVPLPLGAVTLALLNEALREIGAGAVTEGDVAGLL